MMMAPKTWASSQDTGVSPGTANDNIDDSMPTTWVPADVVDHEDFKIDENGVLTFAKAPNFESPTGSSLNANPTLLTLQTPTMWSYRPPTVARWRRSTGSR